jgi:hypothetical protein
MPVYVYAIIKKNNDIVVKHQGSRELLMKTNGKKIIYYS